MPAEMIRSAQYSDPRNWIFTFGQGHRAIAVSHSWLDAVADGEHSGRIMVPPNGFRLSDRYVVIRGTYEDARQRMCEIFGQTWCAQYGTVEAAGVAEYGLTELVITDD